MAQTIVCFWVYLFSYLFAIKLHTYITSNTELPPPKKNASNPKTGMKMFCNTTVLFSDSLEFIYGYFAVK